MMMMMMMMMMSVCVCVCVMCKPCQPFLTPTAPAWLEATRWADDPILLWWGAAESPVTTTADHPKWQQVKYVGSLWKTIDHTLTIHTTHWFNVLIIVWHVLTNHLCFKPSGFKGSKTLVDKLTQPTQTLPSLPSLGLGQAPDLMQLLLGQLLFGIVVRQRLNHLDTISTPSRDQGMRKYEAGMVPNPAVHGYFHMSDGTYLR